MAKFSAGEKVNVEIIIQECLKQGLTLPEYREDIAYILATARHETASWQTLQEFRNANGSIPSYWNNYGGGWKFHGRGYVQLTHKSNYEKFSRITGKDLVNNPDLLLEDTALSAFILVYGMKNGSFTGISLSACSYKYGPNDPEVKGGIAKIGERAINFRKARTIVNGTDKDVEIAGYADAFLARLNKGEFNYILQKNNLTDEIMFKNNLINSIKNSTLADNTKEANINAVNKNDTDYLVKDLGVWPREWVDATKKDLFAARASLTQVSEEKDKVIASLQEEIKNLQTQQQESSTPPLEPSKKEDVEKIELVIELRSQIAQQQKEIKKMENVIASQKDSIDQLVALNEGLSAQTDKGGIGRMNRDEICVKTSFLERIFNLVTGFFKFRK